MDQKQTEEYNAMMLEEGFENDEEVEAYMAPLMQSVYEWHD